MNKGETDICDAREHENRGKIQDSSTIKIRRTREERYKMN